MPRKPRIHFPGAVYHTILRGNAGQDVFFDAADRNRFYQLLQEGAERFGFRIHAFCLMTNHIHLAVQVGEIPLSRVMQNLGFRYTQYLNRKRKLKGHLFQGRYKALLIDADSYLLELVRYLHLNPVRAGMVKAPEAYAWSSHGAYLGQQPIPWLTTDWVYRQFSEHTRDAMRLYRRFVTDGLKEAYRKEFHRGTFEGRALGDDAFIERALAKADADVGRKLTLATVLAAVCRVYDLPKAELASRSRVRRVSEARAMAALAVREAEGLSLVELGRHVNQDVSSLSQAARRLAMRMKEDALLAERVAVVERQFPNCQA